MVNRVFRFMDCSDAPPTTVRQHIVATITRTKCKSLCIGGRIVNFPIFIVFSVSCSNAPHSPPLPRTENLAASLISNLRELPTLFYVPLCTLLISLNQFWNILLRTFNYDTTKTLKYPDIIKDQCMGHV